MHRYADIAAMIDAAACRWYKIQGTKLNDDSVPFIGFQNFTFQCRIHIKYLFVKHSTIYMLSKSIIMYEELKTHFCQYKTRAAITLRLIRLGRGMILDRYSYKYSPCKHSVGIWLKYKYLILTLSARLISRFAGSQGYDISRSFMRKMCLASMKISQGVNEWLSLVYDAVLKYQPNADECVY